MVDQLRSGKLVRDKIPDVIRGTGGDPATVVLNDTEYAEALEAKLHEEVDELLTAPEDKRTEEMSDVLEVLRAMAKNYRIDWDTVEAVGVQKCHDRGGFERRIWLHQ
jgi:predicted house-cleaning noncanonical NTP pyrophosphatase (MazG superfamily)